MTFQWWSTLWQHCLYRKIVPMLISCSTLPTWVYFYLFITPISNQLDPATHSYYTYTTSCWEKHSVELFTQGRALLHANWVLRSHPTQFLLKHCLEFTVFGSPISDFPLYISVAAPYGYSENPYRVLPCAYLWLGPCNVDTLTSKF